MESTEDLDCGNTIKAESMKFSEWPNIPKHLKIWSYTNIMAKIGFGFVLLLCLLNLCQLAVLGSPGLQVRDDEVAKNLLTDMTCNTCIYVNIARSDWPHCDEEENTPKNKTCLKWLSKEKTVDEIMERMKA